MTGYGPDNRSELALELARRELRKLELAAKQANTPIEALAYARMVNEARDRLARLESDELRSGRRPFVGDDDETDAEFWGNP